MLTRRSFVLGAAALAGGPPDVARSEAAAPAVLKLQRRAIEVNGKAASVYGIRHNDEFSGFVANVGARFRVRVENELAEPSLLHWHGLAPPSAQDGVPGISGPAIPPSGAAEYDFPLAFGGTHFMHAHVGFQEQSLLAAPLIVRDPAWRGDWQEIVVMLVDFSFRPAREIYESLVGTKAGHNMAHMDMGDKTTAGMDREPMTGGPGRKPDGATAAAPDLVDVDYDAFLANDRTLADPQVVAVENGGRVLLRIINGASMTAFHVDLGGLEGQLVAVDGQPVEPVSGRRFPIAAAQRLDIQATPKGAKAFPVLFEAEGERKRTGIILAPGGAHVGKIQECASQPAEALDLSLEASLRAARPLAVRKADRTVAIDLTGDMANYVWSINNVVWNEKTPPIPLVSGERVELAMTNRTMMSHPMHLHGHRFQVVEIDGRRFSGAVRDTALVPPGKRVVVAFDADNPGHWAFHCHLLYHAQAGMFATFKYA